MPEGPEIRREAGAIARALRGRPLRRVDYRVRGLGRRARRLEGASVTRAWSQGKALLIAFDRGLVHYSHNQLYGRWRVVDAGDDPGEARAIRVVLATDRRAAILYSATEIELLAPDEIGAHRFLSRLGPDALDRATTPARVAARLADTRFARTSLGHLLLDQRFVAGLGNYLRSDSLHAAGLRADDRPADLDAGAIAALARAIVALPRQSYRTSGVTNDPAREKRLAVRGVPFEDRRFLVYGREGEPCWTCGTAIRRVDAAGRGWFFCPRCQPARRRGATRAAPA